MNATAQQRDKTILHTQVLSEYNKKFIEPRVFVRKRDIGTSTPTTNSPAGTPSTDTGVAEAFTSTYAATGADIEAFRRKYGPVQHTPIQPRHVSVGSDFTPYSPLQNISRPPTKHHVPSIFDLSSGGGNDFPSPIKVPRLRQENDAKTM